MDLGGRCRFVLSDFSGICFGLWLGFLQCFDVC